MDTLQDLTLWAAGLAAVVYLFHKIRRAFLIFEAAAAVVTRELEHNHGSSMKDDVHGMAVALGETQRQVDGLTEQVATLTTVVSDHITRSTK